jgi:tetratricopeptide (TPR) repeat protein
MKHLVVLMFLILAVALPSARAQSNPDDQYLTIYTLMQQADALGSAGQPRQALTQYADVQAQLQKFQRVNPDWNPRIINFRLKYLAEKIDEMTAQLPAATLPTATNSPAATNVIAPNPAGELQSQLDGLRAQMQNLQADNATLEAKLKEALAAQPAAVDPRELAAARENIRTLMKENDLLKASAVSNRTGIVVAATSNPASESEELKQARQALAEANQKLAAQTARVDRLAAENQNLQARMQSLLASADAAQALREENALLKKQLAEIKTATTNLPVAVVPNPDVEKVQLQIAALRSELTVRTLEKLALENRVKQLQIAAVSAPLPSPPAAPDQKENEARIRELTLERDNLLAKLGAANQQLYGRSKQDVAARIDALTDQVNTLRARIAVDEAQPVPYSPEELALFRQAAPLLANPDSQKKSIKELPGGVAQLVAEAQTHFAAKEYDQAEDDYLKILERDENNGLALANLATIELQQNKLEAAEKHAQAALIQSPNDAFNLATLGKAKFAQGKFDEAADALSRAAKADPQNPEIQNYLGATLAQKGLRSQAETAFRKAVQLDPNYAPAHNNLAAIYLNQQPPLVQLARWHYQKALDAGQPRNLEMEKMLDEKGAAVSPP